MIRKIDIQGFDKYLKDAKRNGLVFCNNTDYYGLFIDKEIVGFCGVITYKNKYVFKNDYVIEKHRGNGYHKQMMNFRLALAKKNNIKKVEATCTNMSINNYFSFGFQIYKKYKLYTKLYLTL